jgi:serine protease inhibitor
MHKLSWMWGKKLGAIATTTLVLAIVFAPQVHHRPVQSFSFPRRNSPSAKPSRDQTTRDIYTQFAFNLFSTLQQQQSQENIFISPASISNALAMTYNGAGGTTQEAIARVLEIQGMSVEDFNQMNADLNTSLVDEESGIEISLANSLWLRQDASFLPSFLQRVNESYQAELNQLDFTSPTAADEINAWVREQTQEKIGEILDEVDPLAVLYLLNAIYFKGIWTEAFSEELTYERSFHLMDGTTKPHLFMHQEAEYLYLENSEVQAISLPYSNGQFSLYVLLPQREVNLDRFYQELTAEKWNEWIKGMQLELGIIALPRFELKYSISLNNTLEQMGMAEAFQPGTADFSEMTTQNVYISEVKHKTFLEINEAGTEAAAVTSIGSVLVSMDAPVPDWFEMTVDRPFFLAIRDNRTGTLLFMGSIVDPT